MDEMKDMNVVDEGMSKELMYGYKPGLEIGAQCIVEIQRHYFLLVELEAKSGRKEFERVIVLELSPAAYEFLREKGVKMCEVKDKVPEIPGKRLELKCTFVVGNQAFIIFEAEGYCGCDKLIVVKSPLCCICDNIG